MPSEWNLYYPSWMIADGEPNGQVGEVFEWFSIEFWTVKCLERTDERRKSAIPGADFNYQVVAEVAYLSEKACVIDFGLRAIRTPDLLSPKCKQGDYLSALIRRTRERGGITLGRIRFLHCSLPPQVPSSSV
jgi:hypothetical protein